MKQSESSESNCDIRVSPRTCRHTFAHLNLKNGIDLYTLFRILGHENVSITQRYMEEITDEDVIRMAGKSKRKSLDRFPESDYDGGMLGNCDSRTRNSQTCITEVIHMFLCREQELRVLNQRYQSDVCECVVIYGRRRVGKTALITEFVKDKKAILFPALRANAMDNLEALSKSIHLYRNPDATSAPVFRSFDDAFSEITRIAERERVVFVIDELPYLCDSDSSIASRLQHLLDHDWARTKLFLILCGSSMSFMEKEVLGEKSPLFGRRTAQLKVMPLSYRDAARFHPELSPEDNAVIYGITGGIPHYINLLNVRGSIRDALIENLFTST